MSGSVCAVTEALYQSEGKPVLDKAGEPQLGPRCGNCGHLRPVVPAADILTSRFGSWDDITIDPGGRRWLCIACGWAYRSTMLRRQITLVHHDNRSEVLTSTAAAWLLERPLAADQALIVPLSGKRIVAPRARWGHLVTDSGPLVWTPAHRALLRCASTLRRWGFSERALAELSPPFDTLVKVPADQHQQVRETWRRFAPAREDKTMLALYLRLSRKS